MNTKNLTGELGRRQGQWIYYQLNPQLPPWVHAILAQTAEAMANRPGAACCA